MMLKVHNVDDLITLDIIDLVKVVEITLNETTSVTCIGCWNGVGNV
ncbi:hypothetical protein [Candidatus Hodgkinia cicadicola]